MKLELFFPIRDSNKRFILSQSFGTNGDYYRANGIDILGHNGLDIVCDNLAKVYAAHDGVAYTQKDSRGGLGVIIVTNEEREIGTTTAYAKTIYWHLASWGVSDGQQVKVGDVIGYADSTGLSNAVHLHFGLKPLAKNGEQPWQWYNTQQDNGYQGCIDPSPFFNGAFADQVPIQRSLIEKLSLLVLLLRRKVAEKLQPK